LQWGSAPIRVPEQSFLTVRDVAKVVGVHPKTIQRWVREGTFPAPKRRGSGKEVWSNMAVGVWLAWQDYAPNPATPVGGVGSELPAADDPEPPPRRGKGGT
jgi:excisionase family DNA binding protein